MANRLIGEKSPYLIQHSNNPVDWYPWCKEAFDRAKAEDKPVFVSIGYSTCHWCHVMAQESFEDHDIAEMLNRDYVCIKVDREERPDIDAVYMATCQAMTGAGGWPLSVFMTAEQKPFFTGTYFPKTGHYGQWGFMDLLRQITQIWRTDREKLLAIGERILDFIGEDPAKAAPASETELLEKVYHAFKGAFSEKWGGFGSAPKFPSPHNLMLLMCYYRLNNDKHALHMVERTLDAMAAGGIFDHIGGGFSRYSTDESWLIPHFEKMLYDNALLLITYTAAYQLTGKPLYCDIVKRTASYMLRELVDENGGFSCGQDADSDGVEGGYYVFTQDEIRSALGISDAEEFCRLYGIGSIPNFEGGSIPNRIGIASNGWSYDDIRLEKLYRYRKERKALKRDDKLLLSWNAWAITALSYAGQTFEEHAYTSAAIKTQRFIEQAMRKDDRLYHRFRDGEAAHTGQHEDYAVYCLSLIALYRATFDTEYLRLALHYAIVMTDLFEDREYGGYYIYAHDAERLIVRPKETYDGAIPSGNSVAAMVLGELAGLTGDKRMLEAHNRQYQFILRNSAQYPAGYSFGLISIAERLYQHGELLCAFNKTQIPDELKRYLQNNTGFGLSILHKSNNNAYALASVAPFTEQYQVPQTGAMYYLCKNGACKAPVSDFRQLEL